MDSIVELGCIACRVMGFEGTPAEVHHIHGKTKPDAHFHTIPLCPAHHRHGFDNEEVVSRHPHKTRFEERYGNEEYLRSRVCDLVGSDPLDACKHHAD